MILLDSSVLIELFRKKEKQNSLFYSLSMKYTDFCISSITNYEIAIGNRKSHAQYWESLSDSLRILPFDKICSDAAVAVYLDLLKSNKMIDLADIFIGATAIAYHIPLATANVKHFERIKDLNIIEA